MTRNGLYLALLRLCVFALVMAGLLALPEWMWGLAFFGAAILVYALVPRPRRPEGALTYERAPAIVVPDWLGLIAGGVLTVLPFWAARGSGWDGPLHPMAWLVWPVAAPFVGLMAIAWRNEAYSLVIGSSEVTAHTGLGARVIAFDQITGVAPWRRGIPRVLRFLTPVLIATGHYTQAGALILARDSVGVLLECKGVRPLLVKADGFEKPTRTLVRTLHAQGIPLAAGLSHYLGRKKKRKG